MGYFDWLKTRHSAVAQDDGRKDENWKAHLKHYHKDSPPTTENCGRLAEAASLEIQNKQTDVGGRAVAAQGGNSESTHDILMRTNKEYRSEYKTHHNADGSPKKSWLKAPNGKTTNLTPEQWVLVRTPTFKRWFGDWTAYNNGKALSQSTTEVGESELSRTDNILAQNFEALYSEAGSSKIVDANGEPMVVYHATDKDFAEFDPHIRGENSGFSWFSQSKSYGDEYLPGLDAARKRILSCFLNMRNPFDGRTRYAGDSIVEMDPDDGRKANETELRNLSEDIGIPVDEIKARYRNLPIFDLTQSARMARSLAKQGFDGILLDEFGENTFGVMDGRDVKSADPVEFLAR